MWIPRFSLTNFRNYRQLELRLPPHLAIFYGDNAQGKTNLLEAVNMFATTKSHRASSDRELINQIARQEGNIAIARLYAEVQRKRSDIKVEIAVRTEKVNSVTGETTAPLTGPMPVSVRKRIRVNDIARRAIDLVGQVNAVMFSAQDIDLLSGTPLLCRRYLDLVNSQTDSHYLRSLQRYQRVLQQRNHLLRMLQEHQGQPEQLEFWDNELVKNGSYIIKQRWHLVAMLNELVEKIHWELSGSKETLKIVYLPSIGREKDVAETESNFRQVLYQTRRREIGQGVTLAGPHRDNLQFQVNENDMSIYGSRGQQRTVALSLKLAEAQYIHTRVDDTPILLLDDVLSELDHIRRKHLLEFIHPFQQVLFTATDLDHFEPSSLDQAALFRVKQGNIEAA
ncbi:DNA replication/repair protein RecF [Chloroflexota bacterium]